MDKLYEMFTQLSEHQLHDQRNKQERSEIEVNNRDLKASQMTTKAPVDSFHCLATFQEQRVIATTPLVVPEVIDAVNIKTNSSVSTDASIVSITSQITATDAIIAGNISTMTLTEYRWHPASILNAATE